MEKEKENTFRPEPITPEEIEQRAAEAAAELDKLKSLITPEAFKEVKALLDQAEAITDYSERGAKIYIALVALQSMRIATERGQTTENALELLKSIKPKNAIINNSKVANLLPAIAQAGGANVSVDKGARGKEKVLVEFDTGAATIDGQPLSNVSAYDRTVFNAVCTLLEAGNEAFSLDMVYRAMNGLTNSERITADRGTLDPIRDSIDASAKRRITIKSTLNDKEYVYKSQLLPIKELTVRKPQTGEEVTAYKLLEKPALYAYSQSIKQVISVPMQLLDTKTIKKNSAKITVVREYLIRRIYIMKNSPKSQRPEILYSTLFAETGINEAELSQTERNRERTQIKLLLDDLKQKDFIVDYKEYKTGRTFAGVRIIF